MIATVVFASNLEHIKSADEALRGCEAELEMVLAAAGMGRSISHEPR